MKAGKKISFICSHVDSFTAEKGATNKLPVQSNKKCKSVPNATVKVNPPNCHKNKLRFNKLFPYKISIL